MKRKRGTTLFALPKCVLQYIGEFIQPTVSEFFSRFVYVSSYFAEIAYELWFRSMEAIDTRYVPLDWLMRHRHEIYTLKIINYDEWILDVCFPNVRSLHMSVIQDSDEEPSPMIGSVISKFPNVRDAQLWHTNDWKFLEGIWSFNLRSLSLWSDFESVSIAPLLGLKNLLYLDLSWCNVSSLIGIECLEQLVYLDLANSFLVSSIEGIEKLKSLKWLNLEYCTCKLDKNFEVLRACLKLTHIVTHPHRYTLPGVEVVSEERLDDMYAHEYSNGIERLK